MARGRRLSSDGRFLDEMAGYKHQTCTTAYHYNLLISACSVTSREGEEFGGACVLSANDAIYKSPFQTITHPLTFDFNPTLVRHLTC